MYQHSEPMCPAVFRASIERSLTSDVIERNIKLYARRLFEEVISIGEIRGPQVLKQILNLDTSGLAKQELEATEELLEIFIRTHRILRPISLRINSPWLNATLARSLFSLVLLDCLQQYYLEQTREETLSALSWVPDWTKKYSGMIRNEVSFNSLKPNYNKIMAILLLALCFYASYFAVFFKRDTNYKVLKAVTGIFIFYAALEAVSTTLDYCFKRNFISSQNKNNYGLVYTEINAYANLIQGRDTDIQTTETIPQRLSYLYKPTNGVINL